MSSLPKDSLEAVASIVLVALGCWAFYTSHLRADDRPPGPRSLPFIGNAHQVPLEYAEKAFAQWQSRYGDIAFVSIFTRPTLIVNSTTAARELLEKRSAKYSDRPPSVLMSDLLGWGDVIPTQPMGERLRKMRRWIHSTFFAKRSLNDLGHSQTREVHTLLGGLLREPQRFVAHLHRYTSSLVLEAIYGHVVMSDEDEYLTYADDALRTATEVATPGVAIVDFLPWLRYLPTWFPGAGFKIMAAQAKPNVQLAHTKPYEQVERLMAAGDEKPSMVRSLIEEYASKGTLATEKQDIMSAGAITYVAGADTTESVLRTFILAMVLHPEVYTKVQDEVDRVVGNDRLPEPGDRSSLPYLECVLREVYRWNCPVPLGIPHMLREEDVYRGYLLPKNCTIITNLWSMVQDAEMYPEPETFRPERFWGLSEDELERVCPRNVIFGFGRRICPGRRFADASIWLAIAAITATVDIRKARDSSGQEITPPCSFTSGAVSHAKAFVCSMTPRSAAASLVASLAATVPA
ncbi:cytochrome P450 [Rhodofomes roseus]|uniref:Cytochrome P450 n=1 Tax=Rhodofomes roseus TaxID=34475 RepID=A0ABQ8KCD0_9APHY|nr:cytochrome P450 [Rhodofomes roseus]KAH9834641.1 cytochrome P450 [Rhodofomes roseus]